MASFSMASLLDRYGKQVENLHEALSADALGSDREPIRAFRELVDSVVVHRTEAGERLQIEVKGRLAALLGHDVFPPARIWGGGTMVAEVRYGRSPPNEIPQFP
jgi:hypothetical protein